MRTVLIHNGTFWVNVHTTPDEIDRNNKSHAPNRFSAAVDSCTGKFGVGLIALTNLQELRDQLGENSQDIITEVFRQRATKSSLLLQTVCALS